MKKYLVKFDTDELDLQEIVIECDGFEISDGVLVLYRKLPEEPPKDLTQEAMAAAMLGGRRQTAEGIHAYAKDVWLSIEALAS